MVWWRSVELQLHGLRASAGFVGFVAYRTNYRPGPRRLRLSTLIRHMTNTYCWIMYNGPKFGRIRISTRYHHKYRRSDANHNRVYNRCLVQSCKMSLSQSNLSIGLIWTSGKPQVTPPHPRLPPPLLLPPLLPHPRLLPRRHHRLHQV